MLFITRSISLAEIKMGEVLPGKGPAFEPFNLPDFTHLAMVSCDTPSRAAASCVVSCFFMRASYPAFASFASVQMFYFSRGIYIEPRYLRAS